MDFLIIDYPDPNSASRVAAGLFNPITGKTNQPTWRATEIFEALAAFYHKAETNSGEKFIRSIPIYRPFLSVAEQVKASAVTSPWVAGVSVQPKYPGVIHNPLGGLDLRGSGYLNTKIFLKAVKELLQAGDQYREEVFDHGAMLPGEKIQYKDIEASHVIFCEGVKANTNPWFHWAPIKKLKGELLTVRAKLPTEVIFNRGIFAVPAAELDTFLMGSTYTHDPTQGNTDSGINDLLGRAKALFKIDLEWIGQNWGHRPTTPDRRPLLGSHPEYKNLHIFNGLGTKGVSLAPFFAVHLADWLEGKTELPREVNMERFYSLYFQFRERIFEE
jgi:glycine/D-amino acid oxidase-like deaminating enzyme